MKKLSLARTGKGRGLRPVWRVSRVALKGIRSRATYDDGSWNIPFKPRIEGISLWTEDVYGATKVCDNIRIAKNKSYAGVGFYPGSCNIPVVIGAKKA